MKREEFYFINIFLKFAVIIWKHKSFDTCFNNWLKMLINNNNKKKINEKFVK